ncbi:N-acetylmuramoyl-L-alanine amidase [Brevifollis gellanilyticus]|uniref:N-acetylmuramoyl-L-alanine amidase n=1 Tax=Brevifollis gellanilyticus TaxID=748831 RepID=A0A512MI50_9BACT|nr:N-acetylmuramoyl-L-alanine amidase [Brevifollis gellanilyticus]GEP46417.1 hypothetical protein BGE01nite_57080 [Brevifollis gellanilyticus]
MKLCIDPGHGMSNKKSGIYDSGALGTLHEEAALALVWSHELRKACEARGIPVWMTRTDRCEATPLGSRVTRAEQAGCTHLISLHLNDADASSANGFETLYRTTHSQSFAEALHEPLKVMGLRDRGVKLRTDLAVLASKHMPSALIELGFIRNAGDISIVTTDAIITQVCGLLADRLAALEPA